MNVWVYLDHFQGQIVPAAWEAIGLAQRFGSVTALVFGENIGELANAAFEFGAENVLLVDDSTLGLYRAEIYASTLTALAVTHAPDLILFPTTSRCREMAAMCAIDLDSGALTDVVALEREGDDLVATRPICEGRFFEKLVCSKTPAFIALRPRAFERPARQPGKRGRLMLGAASGRALTIVESESVPVGRDVVSLMDASVIVGGGRGILLDEGKQGLALLQELAAVLDGVVAASKPPVETGLLPASQLVGQSGKVVSPNLYVAVGISGAPQHLAGIRSARVIVAINQDAQAPIFTVSRYGVVGDLFQILPPLIEAFKNKIVF